MAYRKVAPGVNHGKKPETGERPRGEMQVQQPRFFMQYIVAIIYAVQGDKVHKKYNYTCQICGKRGGKLQADHNEPYLLLFKKHNIDTYEKAIACIELWNVNNGKTLCVKCHRESDTYGSKVHNAIAKLIN